MRCLMPVLLLVGFGWLPATAEDASPESVKLFNGKDLSGWSGLEGLWSVEDGAIVGRTTEADPIKHNTFLVWDEGQPGDFELTTEFLIESGNSGIQYRSEVVDADKFIVGGYQADIDFSNRFAGIIYSERTGRGILVERGEKVSIGADGEKTKERFADGTALAAAIHPGKWNTYRIVARGNHMVQYINDTKVSELIDDEEGKAARSGVIALQLHQGPAMVVRFKNMVLKSLASGQ